MSVPVSNWKDSLSKLPYKPHELGSSMNCRHCNAKDSVTLSGLNQTGIIVFIVLLLACFPLCWIPFISDGMKKKTCTECGREIL